MVVGLNHRTAPLRIRERVAFTRSELKDGLAALEESAGPGVILSTCNRTEVYSVAPDARTHRDRLLQFFMRYRSVDKEELSPCLYTYQHEEAVRHLLRVVSGLDSMIVGESQVLGQVRDAYGMAVSHGHVDGVLSKLFHHALRVGKRARSETGIGRNALSISHAAVKLASESVGDLRRSRVMVVGAGEAGKLVAQALGKRGAGKIIVVNRTLERARELAGQLGAEAAPMSSLQALLRSVNMVVSSTDAQGVVLSLDVMKRAMATRNGTRILVIDIAVPRDVDPRVADLDNVSLYDLDDLRSVSEADHAARQSEVARVEEMIDWETAQFMGWWNGLEAAPVIAALTRQAETLRRRELDKTLRRMPWLSAQEIDQIEAFSGALVKKMLHQPIVAIKEAQSQGSMQLAMELFGLDGGRPQDAQDLFLGQG